MKILFVCTGNACRSAAAEAILNKIIADNEIPGVEVASCGTKVYGFDESTTKAMIENTIFYDKVFVVDNNKKTMGTKISAVNCDCLVEAEKLVDIH